MGIGYFTLKFLKVFLLFYVRSYFVVKKIV